MSNKHIELVAAITKRHTKEASLETAVVNLCSALDLAPEQQWETGTGPVDTYLHGRRSFIECKATGKLITSQLSSGGKQFEQIRRYIVGLRQLEFDYLQVGPSQNLEWTAIITDGRLWYTWKWQDALGALEPISIEPQVIDAETNPNLLIQFLNNLGQDGSKPLAPAQPQLLYAKDVSLLHTIWDQVRNSRAAKIQFNLWWDSIRASGMEYGDEVEAQSMFVRHCALVSFARSIRSALLDPDGRNTVERERLQTQGFINWVGKVEDGSNWIRDVQIKTDSFDWRKRQGDILQTLYQEIVPKSQRKVYGEYYTPNWLAEMLVEEVLDESWCRNAMHASLRFGREADLSKFRPWGVLDPTCGSGTFLYHAAKRLHAVSGVREFELTRVEQADAIARLVFGIDIHPVAVEFAQTTLLRSLPAVPSRGDSALNIWQGDSLLAEWGQGMQEIDFMRVRPGQESFTFRSPNSNRMFTLPRAFVKRPDFTRDMKRFTDLANGQKDVPEDLIADLDKDDYELMKRSFVELREICAHDGNGIWAFHVNNWISPTLLAERKVNRILANPPWITLNTIRNPHRKETFKDLARRLNVWVGGRRASSFDVASTFVLQCLNMYLDDSNGHAAWVLNTASMSAGTWQNFRTQLYSQYEQIKSLELSTKKPPFTTAAAAVWYIGGESGVRRLSMKSDLLRIEVSDPWSIVKARVLNLDITSLQSVSTPSDYISTQSGRSVFRQGACFRPHILVRVDLKSLSLGSDGKARGTTVPSKQTHWRNFSPIPFTVPKPWIHDVVRSYDLLPFTIRNQCSKIVLPLLSKQQIMVPTEEAMKVDFWREVSAKWEDSPTNKATGTPKTLIDNLNYYNKITAQVRESDRHSRVVYNEGGQIVRAARVPNTRLVDETCFYFDADSVEEALYLVGILNADSLKQRLSETRETDRHFHAHLWRKVPIPRFDSTNSLHLKLVKLVQKVEVEARELAAQHEDWSQVRLSKWIRENLPESLVKKISSSTDELMSSVQSSD